MRAASFTRETYHGIGIPCIYPTPRQRYDGNGGECSNGPNEKSHGRDSPCCLGRLSGEVELEKEKYGNFLKMVAKLRRMVYNKNKHRFGARVTITGSLIPISREQPVHHVHHNDAARLHGTSMPNSELFFCVILPQKQQKVPKPLLCNGFDGSSRLQKPCRKVVRMRKNPLVKRG